MMTFTRARTCALMMTIKETSASRNAGFAVLSTAKASNLGYASLIGVARGGLGAKIRLLGLLRQGRTVFGAPQACFTEGRFKKKTLKSSFFKQPKAKGNGWRVARSGAPSLDTQHRERAGMATGQQ